MVQELTPLTFTAPSAAAVKDSFKNSLGEPAGIFPAAGVAEDKATVRPVPAPATPPAPSEVSEIPVSAPVISAPAVGMVNVEVTTLSHENPLAINAASSAIFLAIPSASM